MTNDGFKTTRQIVKEMRAMENGSNLKVMLVDVQQHAQEFMHADAFAAARRVFSLNDMCASSFDYDEIYEHAAAKADALTPKEVIEDAFVEALEFATKIQDAASIGIQQHMKSANAYYVGGISCRGQLVVGLFT